MRYRTLGSTGLMVSEIGFGGEWMDRSPEETLAVVRAAEEAGALEHGDMNAFLAMVRESGRSSWQLLQNITPTGAVKEQAIAVALTVAERALEGRGACRIHGGGFAGTIQAFVPLDMLESFKAETESVLGEGSCKVLSIRPVGGTTLWP